MIAIVDMTSQGSKDTARAAHGSKFIASQLLLQGPPASSLSFSLMNEKLTKKMGNINIKIESQIRK